MPRLIRLTVALAAILALTVSSKAAYPDHPIRIIVPFEPGAGADLLARTIGSKLSIALGQQVVVINHSGSGGIVGTEAAAHSAADGYTLLLFNNSQTLNASLNSNLPFDVVRDFTPVSMFGDEPDHPGRQQGICSKDDTRTGRASEGGARQNQLRVGRLRNTAAFRRRTVERHGQYRAGARPLPRAGRQQCGAGGQRHPGGLEQLPVLRPWCTGALSTRSRPPASNVSKSFPISRRSRRAAIRISTCTFGTALSRPPAHRRTSCVG